MKKNNWLILLSIVTLVAICLAVTGCRGKDNSEADKKEYEISFYVDGENVKTVKSSGKETIEVPGNPNKTGYVFDGWYLDNNVWKEPFTADSFVNSQITGDLTVYAKFTAIEYTINYEANGGSHNNPSKYTTEDGCSLSDAQKQGYVFCGWYKDAGFKDKVTEIKQGTTGNFVLYAKWEVAEYTATFKSGETVVDTVKFTIETENITEPEIPARKGYTAKWESYTLGTDNITINAVYSVIGYNIVYRNTDNATNYNPLIYNVETETVTLAAASRTGYSFDGWYDGDNKVTKITAGSTGNITLTAKWTPITYTITYSGTKGAENSNVTSYTIETETITFSDIEKTGYDFIGWYNGGERILQIATGSFGDITLTAKWEPTTYKITYTNAEGAENSNVTLYTIETETIILAAASKKGYSFDGWYDGDNNKVTKIIVGSTGNITLTAKWTPITYTITYSGTKGAENSNVTSYTIETATITLADIAKTGYDFNGWYNGDNKVTQIVVGSTGNITLTAKWTPITYTITYLRTKNAENSNVTSYTIETETIILAAASRTGYVFDGWYDGDDNKVTKIIVGSTGNITLTAKWTPITYTITYSGTKGAENSNVTSYTIETATVYLADIEKTGYYFDGWYNDDEFTEKVTAIEQGTTGNIELYARWEIIEYTATFKSGETVVDTVIFTIETESITEPEIPARKGYTAKWESYTLGANDIIINAVYTATYIREDESGTSSETGKYILFGSYPQTKVEDEALQAELNGKIPETLPTENDANGWTSYGYYISGSVQNFMWYRDEELDGEKYRAVYFISYRPFNCRYDSNSSYSLQTKNGYEVSTVYWFKYEPIKWRILEEKNGKAFLLAELALDSQQYQHESYSGTKKKNGKDVYSNNYEESDIRKWLNDSFYNTAFSSEDQPLIQTTTVDNSAESAGKNGSVDYACADTKDKIFLLSVKEASTTDYGFADISLSGDDPARMKKGTDYAKCQGLNWYYWEDSDYKGYSLWLLRSPYNSSSGAVMFYVDVTGFPLYYGIVFENAFGIVPAMYIEL